MTTLDDTQEFSEVPADPLLIRIRIPVEGHPDFCCWLAGWCHEFIAHPDGGKTLLARVVTTRRKVEAYPLPQSEALTTLRSLHKRGHMAFLDLPYETLPDHSIA